MSRHHRARLVMAAGLAIVVEQVVTGQTVVLGTGLFLVALGFLEWRP